jgi:transposase-like protein
LLGTHTVCQSCGMDTPPATQSYKNHRFPVEIISHATWLYLRFCRSFQDVEELLLERGISVTYEPVMRLGLAVDQATDIFERVRQRLIEQRRDQSAAEPKPGK